VTNQAPAALRLFAALELPPEARSRLADALAALKAAVPREAVRWVRPEGIHLTVRFYGEVPQSQLTEIEKTLAAAAADSQRMTLRLGALGFFPPAGQTRVVWIGLEGDLSQLESLQKAAEASARRLGFVPENRPFHPHLTLGRVQGKLSPVERQKMAERVSALPLSSTVFSVSQLSLMRSDLRPGGSIYSRQCAMPLGG
jgi:RNA 2',3'-cyclic 3'-phosphodiesterase